MGHAGSVTELLIRSTTCRGEALLEKAADSVHTRGCAVRAAALVSTARWPPLARTGVRRGEGMGFRGMM